MIELLCVETHPDGVVKAGNTYPLISEGGDCDCDTVDVGIKLPNPLPGIGTVTCDVCHKTYKNTGIWWLRKSRFVEVGQMDEHATYEESAEKELQLQEK